MNNLTCMHENKMIEIKALNLKHTNMLYDLIDSSREQLKNLTWSQTATLDSTKQFIVNKNKSEDQVHGVFYDNILVGVLELRKKENNIFELGYWLGTQYRGQHIMPCAVKTLVESKVEDTTIVAHIKETNLASYKVLNHAGLVYSHKEVWEGENWIHLKRTQPKNKLKL